MHIRTKTALTTVLFMGILTAVIAFVGYRLYYNDIMDSFVNYADTVLEYAYRASVKYSFGDMIADREMPEGYEEFRSELNEIKDSSNIEYLYAIYFEDIEDIHSLNYAINAKTQEERAAVADLSEIYTYMGLPCEEGSFEDDTLLTLRQAILDRKRENGALDGFSDEYGHMLNGYRVVFDSDDNPAGLICVEIDINRINKGVRDYVRTVILTALVLTAIVIMIYMRNIKRDLIDPVVRITESSDAFVKKMQSNAEPEELIFQDARVGSGWELRLLADNVKSMADGVASYMTNLKAVTSEKERIGTELNLAARIQEAMLPDSFPAFPGRRDFDICAVMDPAKEVGGDFYDFFLVDDTHLCIVVADVSGKGVPGALFMMISKSVVQNSAMTGCSPAEVLEAVNNQICRNNREEMFVTVWLGILDTVTGTLTASSAGHEYPALLPGGGSFELVKDRHGLVIGARKGIHYRNYELQLMPGAKLFLYTDGVPEASNQDNEMFGTERMLAALNIEPSAEPQTILRNVRKAVDDFVGEAEQFDDITMLCFEYKGGAASGADSGEETGQQHSALV